MKNDESPYSRYLKIISEGRMLARADQGINQLQTIHEIIAAKDKSVGDRASAEATQLLGSQSAQQLAEAQAAQKDTPTEEREFDENKVIDFNKMMIEKAEAMKFSGTKFSHREYKLMTMELDFGEFCAEINVINGEKEEYQSSTVGSYTGFERFSLALSHIHENSGGFSDDLKNELMKIVEGNQYIDYMRGAMRNEVDELHCRHLESDLETFNNYEQAIEDSYVFVSGGKYFLNFNGADIHFSAASFDFSIDDLTKAIHGNRYEFNDLYEDNDKLEVLNLNKILEAEIEFKATSIGLSRTIEKESFGVLADKLDTLLDSYVMHDQDDTGYTFSYSQSKIDQNNVFIYSEPNWQNFKLIDDAVEALNKKILEITGASQFEKKKSNIINSLNNLHESLLKASEGLYEEPRITLKSNEENDTFSLSFSHVDIDYECNDASESYILNEIERVISCTHPILQSIQENVVQLRENSFARDSYNRESKSVDIEKNKKISETSFSPKL